MPRPVLDGLRRAQLIRLEERNGATWLELSHDRLTRPAREDNGRWYERHLNAVQKAARVRDQTGRPDAMLPHGRSLREAKGWRNAYAGRLRSAEAAFMQRAGGLSAERRRRRLAVDAVAAVLAGAAYWVQREIHGRQRWCESRQHADSLKVVNDRLLTVNGELRISEAKETTQRNVAEQEARLAKSARTAVEARRTFFMADEAAGLREIDTALALVAADGLSGGDAVAYGIGLDLLSHAGGRKLANRERGHRTGIVGLSVSDGRDGRIITAGVDGTVLVWDRANLAAAPVGFGGADAAPLPPAVGIHRWSPTPSDRAAGPPDTAANPASALRREWLAVLGFDRRVRLWSADDLGKLGRGPGPIVLKHDSVVRKATFIRRDPPDASAASDAAAELWFVTGDELGQLRFWRLDGRFLRRSGETGPRADRVYQAPAAPSRRCGSARMRSSGLPMARSRNCGSLCSPRPARTGRSGFGI